MVNLGRINRLDNAGSPPRLSFLALWRTERHTHFRHSLSNRSLERRVCTVSQTLEVDQDTALELASYLIHTRINRPAERSHNSFAVPDDFGRLTGSRRQTHELNRAARTALHICNVSRRPVGGQLSRGPGGLALPPEQPRVRCRRTAALLFCRGNRRSRKKIGFEGAPEGGYRHLPAQGSARRRGYDHLREWAPRRTTVRISANCLPTASIATRGSPHTAPGSPRTGAG